VSNQQMDGRSGSATIDEAAGVTDQAGTGQNRQGRAPLMLGGPDPERKRRRAALIVRSGTLRFVGKRILAAIPVLWGVTFLAFSVMNLLPGDAAQALLGENATPAEVHALAIKLHLNEPFFTRYLHWLGGAFTGNLGSSLANGQSVWSILDARLPVSFELVLLAFVISLAFAVPVAILSARKPGGLMDRFSMGVSMISLSVAPFVLGILLVLVFAVKLGWLPAIGYKSIGNGLWANLRTMILPAVSIALPLFGSYTRLLRADIIEQLLGEEYVLTARSKGATPWQVLTGHVLRNSVFGLVTLIGLNLGTLIGSTVVVEQIFAIPGIGSELLQAINNRDVTVVEGTVLVFAVVVVAASILTDLLYSVLDPRIRHGRTGN
jgi:peptide/nickel transport system permease protein